MKNLLLSAIATMVLVLALGQDQGRLQEPAPPSVPRSPQTTISVFFEKGMALETDEIKSKAKQALSSKGVTVSDGCHCGINVAIAGKWRGVVVFFQDFRTQMIHVVKLDPQGKIVETFSGKQHEGVPPAGAPTPPPFERP